MPPLRGASSVCVDTHLTERPVVPQRLRPRPSSLKGLRRRGLIYWGVIKFWCAFGSGPVTAAKLAPRRSVEPALGPAWGPGLASPGRRLLVGPNEI